MADEFAQSGVILHVEEKQLYRKSDNAPFTLYKIGTDTLGELSTTDRPLFLQAQALLNQGVLLTYTETQKDGYTNRYLKRINLSAQAAQQSLPAPPAPPQAQPYANQPIGRDEAIWRQTATKTAASFNNKDLAEYWERVAMLMDFYRSGVIPGVAQTDAPDQSFLPSPATVMPSQNTFIPEAPGDRDDFPPAPVSDDDIPF